MHPFRAESGALRGRPTTAAVTRCGRTRGSCGRRGPAEGPEYSTGRMLYFRRDLPRSPSQTHTHFAARRSPGFGPQRAGMKATVARPEAAARRRCGDGRIRAAARPHARRPACRIPLMLLSRRLDDKEIQLKNQSQILLPDQRRRTRGRARRGRHAPARRLRLVPPVLPRPRAVPRARRDAARDAAAGRRRQGRSRVGRAPDALALGQPAPQHRLAGQPDRHAGAAGGRMRRGGDCSTGTSRRFPGARSASIQTRSPTSRSATAPPAKASSGNR